MPKLSLVKELCNSFCHFNISLTLATIYEYQKKLSSNKSKVLEKSLSQHMHLNQKI